MVTAIKKSVLEIQKLYLGNRTKSIVTSYLLLLSTICIMSLIRPNIYIYYFTHMPLQLFGLLFFLLGALLAIYTYLLSTPSRLNKIHPKDMVKMAIPILLILVIAPPLFSRDHFAYLIPARNLVSFGLNPYTTNINNSINDWYIYIDEVWQGTSLYPPTFIVFVSIIYTINSYTSNYLVHIIFYKSIMLAVFLGLIWISSKLVISSKDKNLLINAIILNPALLLNLILDAHNDLLVIFFITLMLYWLQKMALFKSSIFFIVSFLTKYFSILLIPLYWYKNGKFKLSYFLVTLLIPVVVFMSITYIYPNFFDGILYKLPIRGAGKCFYGCNPIYKFFLYLGNGDVSNSVLIKVLTFIITSIFIINRYAAKYVLTYTFWINTAFFLIVWGWLTPWYLCLPIVFGVLAASEKGRGYLYLSLIITIYSFLRFLGF